MGPIRRSESGARSGRSRSRNEGESGITEIWLSGYFAAHARLTLGSYALLLTLTRDHFELSTFLVQSTWFRDTRGEARLRRQADRAR